MKLFFSCSILLCSLICCYSSWVTNSTIPNVTTTSSLISSLDIDGLYMFKDPSGDRHVFLAYCSVAEPWAYLGTFWDVNVDKTNSHLATGSYGRFNLFGEAFYNGLFYICGQGPGYFQSYNPTNGTVTQIHSTSDDVQTSCVSDSGIIFLGGATHQKVDSWNPSTSTWTSWGYVDTNLTDVGSHFVYTIGADSRYVYCGLGQSPWYLGIIDTTTGLHSTYWSNANFFNANVVRGTNGGYFYDVITNSGDSIHGYFTLENGIPTVTNAIPPVYTPWLNKDGVSFGQPSYDNGQFAADYNLDVDVTWAYPDSTNNWATALWSVHNSNTWASVSITNFSNLAPLFIKRAYANGDGRLLILTYGYGPLLWYTPSSSQVSVIGRMGMSSYDACKTGNVWYISGYTSMTFGYDTSSPWTLSSTTTDKHAVGVNARQFTGGWGQYHYYSCFGSDGLLYIGATVERNGVGGYLGWFDTSTYTSPGNLRDPFAASNDRAGDLKSSLGGTKMIYLSGADNNLFVVDVSTKTCTATNSTILPGISKLGKCIESSNGVMTGMYGTSIWQYDVVNNIVLYTNTLPGTAWSGFSGTGIDYRISLGPDGYIWITLDNDLYRIHPITCSPQLIKTGVNPHNICFNGGDAYLYSPSDSTLHVLSGLLLQTQDVNATTLRVGTMRMAQ